MVPEASTIRSGEFASQRPSQKDHLVAPRSRGPDIGHKSRTGRTALRWRACPRPPWRGKSDYRTSPMFRAGTSWSVGSGRCGDDHSHPAPTRSDLYAGWEGHGERGVVGDARAADGLAALVRRTSAPPPTAPVRACDLLGRWSVARIARIPASPLPAKRHRPASVLVGRYQSAPELDKNSIDG